MTSLAVNSATLAARRVHIAHRVGRHTHDFAGLSFLTHGSGIHSSASGTSLLTPGAVVLTGIGAWHAYVPQPDCTVLALRIDRAILEDSLPWLRTLDGIGPILDPTIDVTADRKVAIAQLDPFSAAIVAPAMTDLVHSRGAIGESPLYRISRLFEILHGIAHLWPSAMGDGSSAVSSDGLGAPVANIQRAKTEVRHAASLMHRQLHEHPSISDIAKRVGLSISQLERQFLAELGMSPTAYLANLRLREFARLLRETRMNVTEAARSVGWTSASHAGDTLRQRTGMTPTQYREEHGRRSM